jgi:hypothetical protein
MKLVLKDKLDVDREQTLAVTYELLVALEEFLAWVDRDKWHRVSEETTRLAEAYVAFILTLCEEVEE